MTSLINDSNIQQYYESLKAQNTALEKGTTSALDLTKLIQLCRNIEEASTKRLDLFRRGNNQTIDENLVIGTYLKTVSLVLQTLRKFSKLSSEEICRKYRSFLVRLIELEQYKFAEVECWRLFCLLKFMLEDKSFEASVGVSISHEEIIKGIRFQQPASDKSIFQYVNFMILYLQTVYLSYKHRDKMIGSEELLILLDPADSYFLQVLTKSRSEIKEGSIKLLNKLFNSFISLSSIPRILKALIILKCLRTLTQNQSNMPEAPYKNAPVWFQLLLTDIQIQKSPECEKIYKYLRKDVYNFVSFYDKTSNTLNIDLGNMYQILNDMCTIKKKHRITDDYDWDIQLSSIKQSFAKNDQLELLLANISLNSISDLEESIETCFYTVDLSKYKDEQFLKRLFTAVSTMLKRTDLIDACKQLISQVLKTMNAFFNNLRNTLLKAHLNILDSITLFMKDSIEAPVSHDFITENLVYLSEIFKNCGQIKRVRNISNLYYNIGLKILRLYNKEEAPVVILVQSLSHCISIEQMILSADNTEDNLKQYQAKLQRVVSILISFKQLSLAMKLITIFLQNIIIDTATSLSQAYHEITTKCDGIFGLFFKTIVQSAKDNNDKLDIRFETFSPSLRAIIFLKLIQTLIVLKLGNKTLIANLLFESLKIDEDPVLYYYCYIRYLDVPNLSKFIEIELFDESNASLFDKSILSKFKLLIMSILNFKVLIKYNSELTNPNLILELFELFLGWITTSGSEQLILDPKNELLLNLEVKNVRQIVSYYKYYGLKSYLAALITCYEEHRGILLSSSPDLKLYLLFESVECFGRLNFSKAMFKRITEASSFMTKTQNSLNLHDIHLLKLKVYQLEYCIMVSDLNQGQRIFDSIFKFISSRPKTFLLSIDDFISNKFTDVLLMLVYSRLSFIISKLKFELGVFKDCIFDLRRSIRITLVIIKKLSQSSSSELYKENVENTVWEATVLLVESYSLLIETNLHFGFSKDCEYYTKELVKVAFDGDFLPLISLYVSYLMIKIYYLRNNLALVKKYFEHAQTTYASCFYIDKELEVTHCYACITYYHSINDVPRRAEYYTRLTKELNLLADYAIKLDDQSIGLRGNLKETLELDTGYSSMILAVYNQMETIDLIKLYNLKLQADNLQLSRFTTEYLGKITYLKSISMNELDLYKHSKLLWPRNVLLSGILSSKRHLLNAKRGLSADPVLAVLQDSATSIPSVDLQMTTARLFSRSLKISEQAREPAQELIQSRDIITKNSNIAKTFSSNIELYELSYIFSYTISILSAISDIYKFKYLTEMLFFNELPRVLPFIYEKLMCNSEENVKILVPLQETLSYDVIKRDMSGVRLQEEIASHLPEDWNVITVDICPFTGDLMLTKIVPRNSQAPFVARLPLNRFASRDVNEETLLFKDAKNEFLEIIELNNQSTKLSRTSQISDIEGKKKWWKERYKLNARLEKLLKDIEYFWLGGFKGIFNQQEISDNGLSHFKTRFIDILEENLPSRKALRAKLLKSMRNKTEIKQLQKIDIDDSVLELFLALGNPDDIKGTELLEDLIYFVLDILSFHGEENAYDEIDIDQIYVDVEELLKYHHNKYSTEASLTQILIKHTVLVVGKTCQNLPWESLPCLENGSVSRMPSLELLLESLKKYVCRQPLEIDADKGYYILNPGTDLTRTQETFESRLSRNLPSWSRKVCEAPTEEEFLQKLENANLFIYIGHGGGEQYVRNSKLKKLPKCAPSLLLGCSSGSLKDNGQLEPNGTVFSYLIAGCPMVLANLWDVTDKDIDKFSLSVFEKWGVFEAETEGGNARDDENEKLNICEAVARSRKVCVLRYLNGAAPVIYGLPFYVKKDSL